MLNNETDKIMLVDDEDEVVKRIKKQLLIMFSIKESQVITTNSGNSALNVLQNESENIILIIADQNMPEMKGTELLMIVKERYPEIRSIILTAHLDGEDINSLIKADITSYIQKPYEISQLQKEVTNALILHNLEKKISGYQMKLDCELKWAGEIQKMLLKPPVINSDKISYNITYQPVPQLNCGGDYYDIFEFSDDVYLVLIGDVSGHGIRGAFITTMLKSILYHEYIKFNLKDHFSPASFLFWLNNRVHEILKDLNSMFISFKAVLIDLKNMSIRYSDAGHEPVIIIRDKKALILKGNGTVLGYTPDLDFEDHEFQIKTFDHIILYTDGMIEFETDKEEKISLQLYKSLVRNTGQIVEHQKVIDELFDKKQKTDFRDDITLISLDIGF